jgi:hypothetical protein
VRANSATNGRGQPYTPFTLSFIDNLNYTRGSHNFRIGGERRHVWGESKPHNAESLHVHIYRLRNKLAPYGIQIETMVNVGYRLAPAAKASERRRESA